METGTNDHPQPAWLWRRDASFAAAKESSAGLREQVRNAQVMIVMDGKNSLGRWMPVHIAG